MSSFVYSQYKKNLGTAVENLSSNTFKVALFSSSYTPAQNTDCAYAVNPPSTPTTGSTSGGSLAGATYYVKITYVNPAGETTASSEASQVVASSHLLTVTSPSNPGGSVTGWNCYVSTTSGAEQLQNVSPIAIGTGYTEPTSGLVAGASPPGSNTAQISGELSTGNGYTAGGATLSSTSWSTVLANSWADSWTATTGYSLGQIVRPSSGNGYIYLCCQAGTSGSGPSWSTTINALTSDGTVEWLTLNTAATVFSAGNVTWSVSAVLTYRYVVIYDSTTNDLVCLIDPGSNQSSPSSGSIQLNFDSAGIIAF